MLAIKGKSKIADGWEENPYVGLEQVNSDIPVYRAQQKNGEDPVHTLHRKLLLPIGSLSVFSRGKDVPVMNDRSVVEDRIVSNDIITIESVTSDSSVSKDDYVVTETLSLRILYHHTSLIALLLSRKLVS